MAADLALAAGAFGALLHRGGLPVTPARSAGFAEAVLLARPATVAELYWVARVTFVTGHDQLPAFDAAFAQVFRGMADVVDFRGDSAEPPPPSARAGTERLPSTRDDVPPPRPDAMAPRPSAAGEVSAADADAADEEPVLGMASTEETLRDKDFAVCTPEELAALAALLSSLRVVAPPRPSRRSVRHPYGRHLDVRATLRKAHRTGGDPVRQSFRQRKDKRRRIVLLADVSGSMEPYSRVYLHLLHGAVRATRAEAFVFATHLTRLTRALGVSNPDAAMVRAAAATRDWSGGTRIGEALQTFLDEYGRRGLARGSVVVIVSDGWERDDPALLGEQMARLSRLAHRVVWVNPRKAAPAFEPLTGGMVAALPYVDTFVSGHSARALDQVLAAIHG